MAIIEAVISLLAALGLIVGCSLFVAWLRGDLPLRQKDRDQMYAGQTAAYQMAGLPVTFEPQPCRERDEARHEALTRIEEHRILGASVSDSPVETGLEAPTTPPEPDTPASEPHDPARERAREEALARIAARSVATVESGDAARALAAQEAEIEKRAVKAEALKPRPGVRSIDEYDFAKPLRDDLPRSGMADDPLDHLKGYQ